MYTWYHSLHMTEEKTINLEWFNIAAKSAQKSLCLRDKCGAAIVLNGKVIAEGYNAPPQDSLDNQKCGYDFPVAHRKKPKSDCTCCMHAEWRAIMDALKAGVDLAGSTLYFTRVDDQGQILFSGEPYCTVCSRLALDAGISFWALWHDPEPMLYDAQEYNDLSYAFHLKQKSLT